MTSSAYSPPVSDALLATIAYRHALGYHHQRDLIQEGRIAAWLAYADKPDEKPWYYATAAENRIRELAHRRKPYFGALPRDGRDVDPNAAIWIDAASDDWSPNVLTPVTAEGQDDDLIYEMFPELVLHHVYGWSYEEIAEEFNITLRATKARIFRTKPRFQKWAIEHGKVDE